MINSHWIAAASFGTANPGLINRHHATSMGRGSKSVNGCIKSPVGVVMKLTSYRRIELHKIAGGGAMPKMTMLTGLMLLGWSLPSWQAPESGTVIRSSVEMVQLVATVKDRHRKIVKGLSQSDFIVEEGGQVQEIRYFAADESLPLTLVLLVDTSLSQREVLDEEKTASYQFFEQILRPSSDRAGLISFDREAALLADLTGDRDQLERALRRLQVPENGPGQPRAPRGPGRPGGGAGTVLYDAVYLGADEILAPLTGRKAMIVLSDGVDMGSSFELEAAIRMALRAECTVYCIRYADANAYGQRGRMGGGRGPGGYPGPGGGPGRGPGGGRPPADGKKVLERLAAETGGTCFEVSGKNTLEKIYQQIQEELRHQYVIGYPPPAGRPLDQFRPVSLKTRQKGLIVSCRSGYYLAKRK